MGFRVLLAALVLVPVAAASSVVDHEDPAFDDRIVLFGLQEDAPPIPNTLGTPCHDGAADLLRVRLDETDGRITSRLELRAEAPSIECVTAPLRSSLRYAHALVLLRADDGTSLYVGSLATPEWTQACVRLTIDNAEGLHSASECAPRTLDGWDQHAGSWPIAGEAPDAFGEGSFTWDLSGKTFVVNATGRTEHTIDGGFIMRFLDTLDEPVTFAVE